MNVVELTVFLALVYSIATAVDWAFTGTLDFMKPVYFALVAGLSVAFAPAIRQIYEWFRPLQAPDQTEDTDNQ